MAATSRSATVLAGLADIRGWQEEFYGDLHQHPELSHQEHRTAARVAERLRAIGFSVHEGIGGTPYASTTTATDAAGGEVPVMHACGHDVHVTCLLGAAQLLAEGAEHWSGTAVALFQPAEEVGDGARAMVDEPSG
jgi:metal-dependent amidase/aminoacylase/carboxypeptidase family protein